MTGDHRKAASQKGWGYTYEHLDAETQSLFTREEWFLKNQYFANNGSVIHDIESVEVSLRLTYEDGSSSMCTTYFVYEDGEWKRGFGQEVYDVFMPEDTYEEFVAA